MIEVAERCQQIVFFKKRRSKKSREGSWGWMQASSRPSGGVLRQVTAAAWPGSHTEAATLEESLAAASAHIPFSCFLLFPKTKITREEREKSLFEIEREFLCRQLS